MPPALDKKAMVSLLVKYGVDAATANKLSADRSVKKLMRRLEEKGLPPDATEDEIVLAKTMGYKPGGAPATSPASPTEAVPAPVPAPAPAETPAPASAKGTGTGKPKSAAVKSKPAAKATGAKSKPAPAASAKKTGTGMKKEREISIRRDGKPRGVGAKEAFANAFKNRKQFTRVELMAVVIQASGCDEWSVKNYISLAKGKKSPFSFKLAERKTEKGEKVLTKVE